MQKYFALQFYFFQIGMYILFLMLFVPLKNSEKIGAIKNDRQKLFHASFRKPTFK